jgi:hypothetical protein
MGGDCSMHGTYVKSTQYFSGKVVSLISLEDFDVDVSANKMGIH